MHAKGNAGAPQEGVWRNSGGGKGWVADFGKPKATLASHGYTPSPSKVKNRTALDEDLDVSLERFASKHEELLFHKFSTVPDVAVSHIVPRSDPFQFAATRAADSKTSLQEELMFTVNQQHLEAASDSSHSYIPSPPLAMKERFQPSSYLRESFDTAAQLAEPPPLDSNARGRGEKIFVVFNTEVIA